MAITVLRNAGQAARALGIAPDPDWELVAANIPILTFADGTTRENRTYDGVPIKQADALLAYPLAIVTDRARVAKDLASRSAHGARRTGHVALDPGHLVRAHGPGRQGLSAVLEKLSPKTSCRLSACWPKRRPAAIPLATGAGGSLQALIFGFGGLEIGSGGIAQRAGVLPSQWKRLEIRGAGPRRQNYEVR